MTTSGNTSDTSNTTKTNDPYRCATCWRPFAVPSLARACEVKHSLEGE